MDEQLDRLLTGVRIVLGPVLTGAYLYGSAVLGGLQPHSDLDVLAVSSRETTRDEKRRLVEHLLAVSRQPRSIDLTIVVAAEVRPWRYPPAQDFQYGDWWRDRFEEGELEPWPSAANPDLASLVTMVLLADRPLLGPAPSQVFEPVPRRDYVHALTSTAGSLVRDDLDSDTRNVILTLARIWSSLATGGISTKAAAAEWAIPQLPAGCRPVLARARAVYLGEERDHWDDIRPQVRAYATRLLAEIDRLAGNG